MNKSFFISMNARNLWAGGKIVTSQLAGTNTLNDRVLSDKTRESAEPPRSLSNRWVALPVLALTSALYSGAALPAFSFTSDAIPQSFGDDSQAVFEFSLLSPSSVTLVTWSYAGGTNAAGQQIPSGGFDPVISVFDRNGALIDDNDDGSTVQDPDTGLSYDSLLMLELSEGDYAAILTQYPNRYDADQAEFTGSNRTTIADGDRSANWAIDFLGVDEAMFIGLLNPATPPSPPEQEELDEALQSIAINDNTSSTAAVISTACPQSEVGSRFRQDCTPIVVGALQPENTQQNDQATFALAVVTAEQATVPLSSSQASLSTQRQNLTTRLSALRGGATGFNIRGLTINLDSDDAFTRLAGGSLPRGGAASADDSGTFAFGEGRLGAFLNGSISRATKDATSNEEGFDADSWGITAGVDYRFRDDLILGIAGGYNKSSTDIDRNGGDLDTDGYSVSLYGTYFRGENLYLDGILTYGNNNYDQNRNIRYQVADTLVAQTASADYDGHQWSAALGGGYSLSNGPWSYGPVARLEYVSADVDGYSERMSDPNANGGGWAARLDDVDQDSFTTSIGAEVSRAISTSWGVLLPQLHLSWIHEFKDDALSINGRFIQDPTRSVFNIQSDEPDSDYYNARLGVSAQFAGGASGFLYYNKVFGYRNLDVDTFGAGVRLEF